MKWICGKKRNLFQFIKGDNGETSMKKYEYVSFKMGGMLSEKSEQHREIINKCAELGYRYAGYISTNLMPNGSVYCKLYIDF